MQVAALEVAGMIEIKEGKKCWKGYKKAGTQKLFGKTYNRCVKAGDELNHDGEQLQELELPKILTKPIKTVTGLSQGVRDPETNKIKKTDVKGSDQPPMKPVKIKNSYAPVTEGVMTLMKKKEEKKKSKPSVSTYVSKSKSDAAVTYTHLTLPTKA